MAHKFSSNHREQILQSKLCGCFFCLSIFTPSSIERWIDRDKTALCPNCHIDAVIGSKSGLAVTENLLKKMKRLWFDSGR
ncbi:MAG: cytoplasmic protein [Candidatus Melainabacteria bacterium]|nr:cytoplasmic protein [Candidatus Melainabacteria bacterium]